jgi:hypothetical protein
MKVLHQKKAGWRQQLRFVQEQESGAASRRHPGGWDADL